MTSAQLQHLSQDQIDTLLKEAESSVAKFLSKKLIGQHPGPVWPDADNTLHFAVGASLLEWDIGDYKKEPGPDLTSNGCSFAVAAAYKKIFDDQSCRHHNYGYRNLPQYRQTRSEDARQAMDLRFLLDMEYQCIDGSGSDAQKHACDLAALAAYVQARKNGQAAFASVKVMYP